MALSTARPPMVFAASTPCPAASRRFCMGFVNFCLPHAARSCTKPVVPSRSTIRFPFSSTAYPSSSAASPSLALRYFVRVPMNPSLTAFAPVVTFFKLDFRLLRIGATILLPNLPKKTLALLNTPPRNFLARPKPHSRIPPIFDLAGFLLSARFKTELTILSRRALSFGSLISDI